MDQPLDCLIIGGGPAGLTAAIYLARFHLSVALLDAGRSRAALIPRTRNHPGYPGGIPGPDLLDRLKEQAAGFGVVPVPAVAEKIERHAHGFAVHAEPQGPGRKTWLARSVLLATGVVNRRPAVAPEVHDLALARGLLRYCPICDGYEVTDRDVGVIGTGPHGVSEATFLRSYTRSVVLIAPDGAHELDDHERDTLRAAGVRWIDGPAAPLRIDGERIVVPTPGGEAALDSVYPALGSVIRSELAVALGAEASEEGCLHVDSHQRSTVPGLYAAGDVTMGLDQISHAMGEAAVAATTIRNDLDARAPLWRV